MNRLIEARNLFRAFWLVGLAAFLLAGSTAVAGEPFSTTRNVPLARDVIVEDRHATDAFRPRPDRVAAMVNRGITNLTSKATAREAWLSLVSTQDIVGI